MLISGYMAWRIYRLAFESLQRLTVRQVVIRRGKKVSLYDDAEAAAERARIDAPKPLLCPRCHGLNDTKFSYCDSCRRELQALRAKPKNRAMTHAEIVAWNAAHPWDLSREGLAATLKKRGNEG